MINRLGVEQEFFLLKKGVIVEPALYGFPYDEFGFLIEIRTKPHLTYEPLMRECVRLRSEMSNRAKQLGLMLVSEHRLPLNEAFVRDLSKKYNYVNIPDLTSNIYPNVTKSHATGLDNDYGTAGLHIHFSRHTRDGKVVQLPITKIVKLLDDRFKDVIVKAERNMGEYERKVHGFEYRSLPANVWLMKPLKMSFKILWESNNP